MKRARDVGGFTLIELLIVLIIIGLLLALIPRLQIGLEHVRLRATADRLTIYLIQCRELAQETGKTADIKFDPSTRRFSMSGRPDFLLDTNVIAVVFRTKEANSTCSNEIRFFADGSAFGCRIRLSSSHLSQNVSINWVTGRINYDD